MIAPPTTTRVLQHTAEDINERIRRPAEAIAKGLSNSADGYAECRTFRSEAVSHEPIAWNQIGLRQQCRHTLNTRSVETRCSPPGACLQEKLIGIVHVVFNLFYLNRMQCNHQGQASRR